MTLREYVYDLKRLLSKGIPTDESRLNNGHLQFLINQRRSKEIRDSFKRNPVIEPIWIQDYGLTQFSTVSRAEDVSITSCPFKVSKALLPQIVSISDPLSNTSDLGMYAIRSACNKAYEFHQISNDKLFLLDKDSTMAKMKLYTKVGDCVYLMPEVKQARVMLILMNPLDGFVLANLFIPSGSLVVGTVYIVESGNVTHNGIKYFVGQTFTAINTLFTGLGKVQYALQKRPMTIDDPYPMSSTMWEVVKMKILTQDFAIEEKQIADLTGDLTDDATKR